MDTLRGNQLNPEDQKHVLAAFIYRKTHENMWANPAAVKQTSNWLPAISDEQWLAITDFEVTESGRLDRRAHHCMTHDCEIPEHKAIIEAWAAGRERERLRNLAFLAATEGLNPCPAI